MENIHPNILTRSYLTAARLGHDRDFLSQILWVFNSSYTAFCIHSKRLMECLNHRNYVLWQSKQKIVKHFPLALCTVRKTKTIIKLDIGFVASGSPFISLNKFISPVLLLLARFFFEASNNSHHYVGEQSIESHSCLDRHCSCCCFISALSSLPHVQIMEIFSLPIRIAVKFFLLSSCVCLFAFWLLAGDYVMFCCCYLRFFIIIHHHTCLPKRWTEEPPAVAKQRNDENIHTLKQRVPTVDVCRVNSQMKYIDQCHADKRASIYRLSHEFIIERECVCGERGGVKHRKKNCKKILIYSSPDAFICVFKKWTTWEMAGVARNMEKAWLWGFRWVGVLWRDGEC